MYKFYCWWFTYDFRIKSEIVLYSACGWRIGPSLDTEDILRVPLCNICLLDFGNVPTVLHLLLIFGNKRFQQDGFNRTSSNKLLFIGNCMIVLVLKKINNNKNKKIRVCLDFIQNRENTTDLPHVTDTLYHIIVYQVHEYTSIPRRIF
jgi:hypothetical protein